ncbi:MAG TPA: hypothetical protein VLC48_08265 [Gemmatimonadota bacterium]|nr:hypothetical protein [Gemmatimonadota bacterium]
MRIMRRIVLIALSLALPAVPGRATAQDDVMARIRQAYPNAAAEIETIIADAEAAGAPGDALAAKALEGAAKGVPADRVLPALNQYSLRLRESVQLLGRERGPAAVVAGADALRRGVPPEQLRTMAMEHQGDLAVPLMVMGDLIEAGVPANNAYRVVSRAMHQHQEHEEMLAIPGAVRQMMRAGQGPGPAADAVGQAIGSGQFHGARQGPPVPPGSGPPEHADPGNMQGKGKGKGSGG